MKTKYLFSAALLAGMFAACNNEDFVETSTINPNEGRPTVNVKLGVDLNGDPSTRMAFENGYKFEMGDKIGALLMDQIPESQSLRPFTNPEEWAALSWLEKYELINSIHTDYPFTCTEETTNGGTKWESDAKMLEGNYFFAYPYEGYDAKRQMVHSIINQKQDGGDKAAYLKAYADNQFFVGYGQIKEGNATKEALVDVKMSSILGAVVIKLKNSGTVDRTITKITLSAANKIFSLLTIDPTDAGYKGKDGASTYNLTAPSTVFNYANYLNAKDELYLHTAYASATDFVYNIEDDNADKNGNYQSIEALRNTVKPIAGNDDYYAELALTDGGNPGIVVKAQEANTIQTCIMINPITVSKGSGQLILTIYTTDGMVSEIDLTQEKTENNGATNTVKTDQAILNVGPSVANSVTVTFDNNSVQAPIDTKINNSDDLKQYISWVSTLGDKRLNIVELQNSTAIDAASVKLLKDNNIKLYVKAANSSKLQLKEAGVEDALNYIIVDKDCVVEVLGTANIGVATLNRDFKAALENVQQDAFAAGIRTQNLKLEVAKDATLNVAGAQLNGNNASPIAVEITNKGTLVVAKAGDIKLSKLTNASATDAATVNVEGKMTLAGASTNELKGVINVNAGGYLSGTISGHFSNKGIMHNHGAIWNIVNDNSGSVKPSTVYLYGDATACNFNSNWGVIIYDVLGDNNQITGTVLAGLGTIQYTTKYAEGVTKSVNTTNLVKYNVTDLIVTMGKLVSNYGQPSTPYAGAYTATKLKSLVVKGGTTEAPIMIEGTRYPLVMAATAANTFQIEGVVALGASIVSANAFDNKSYIKGNVTVTEKVAFASDATAVANSGATAVSHNVLTPAATPTMKGATIGINTDKFLSVTTIAGAANTTNSIDASGTFYGAASGTITTSGDIQAAQAPTSSDK